MKPPALPPKKRFWMPWTFQCLAHKNEIVGGYRLAKGADATIKVPPVQFLGLKKVLPEVLSCDITIVPPVEVLYLCGLSLVSGTGAVASKCDGLE